MFPVSREELCWEEGEEENTRSEAENVENKSSSLPQDQARVEAERKVEKKDAALLLLQRSKDEEEQEEEKHPRREGRWKTGILKTVKSTAIMTRKDEIWKQWV